MLEVCISCLRLWTTAAAVMLFVYPVRAQKPVLAWSAKFGPSMQSVTGAAVAEDGSIYVAGRTLPSGDPFNIAYGKRTLFVGKLSPDGSNSPCSQVVGGSVEDFPIPIALVPDGTLIIAGFTFSQDFPRVPQGPPQTGQDPHRFLLRVDPCDKKPRYSIYLPDGVQPLALAAAKDGSVYIAASEENSPDKGLLLHVAANGNSILSKTGLRGVPRALAIGPSGFVYATGNFH